MAATVYHICTLASWRAQKKTSYYQHESLLSEGFIHCCDLEQIDGVLDRYFQECVDLILLTINSELLVSDMLYEASPTGEKFPHVYGSIEKAAIVNIEKLR